MRTTRKTMITVVVVGLVGLVNGMARADWIPEPPDNPTNHKMHFPQLPDPDGWDVNFHEPRAIADDWQCTQTGPVKDIHFWMSSRREPFALLNVYVSIHNDDTLGPFGRPGGLLWERSFDESMFTIRKYGISSQGWYDPMPPEEVVPGDHENIYQVNIVDIRDPFFQEEGTAYWLSLNVNGTGTMGPAELGWKTSLSHFRDNAVWSNVDPVAGWQQLFYPFTSESLDMAFVITPEPATLALLLLGGLAMMRRKR